ncbi:MAG: tetratricopeptide repeat protein [Pseudomonadota bacterium]
MSVINQMLQDLERRHAGPEELRALPDEIRPLPAAGDQGRLRRIGGWWLVVASAGVAAAAWLAIPGRIDVPMADAPAVNRMAAAVPDTESVAAVQPQPAAADPGTVIQPEAGPAQGEIAWPAFASRMSTDLAAPPSAPPPELPDRRMARREGVNAQTEHPMREAAAGPGPAAAGGAALAVTAARPSRTAATPVTTPAVVASFGAVVPAAIVLPTVPAAMAPPAAAVSASSPAAAASGARQADTSPPRIERQDREPGIRERTEASYRRGVEALQDNRLPAAEQALREALALSPGHEPSRHALLGMLVQQRRNADAEALLAEGQRQNPAQVGFAMALARLQAERGDAAAALDSLQRSATAGRERPEFLGFQAGLLSRIGNHGDAVLYYRSALRLVPQNAVWWMGLGISLEADRRPSEAAEAFQRARETTGLNAELTAFVDQRLRNLQR